MSRKRFLVTSRPKFVLMIHQILKIFEGAIRNSLLWLRDELCTLSYTYNCRHDAAADLIHMYAYTKCFFRVRDYKTVKSPPVHISPLDLGPKYADKLGPGFQEYCKTPRKLLFSPAYLLV